MSDSAHGDLLDLHSFPTRRSSDLRAIPFQRDFVGRSCALTYANAANVLVTNCDNILAVNRLGLRDFRFVPHPILEEWAGDRKSTRSELQSQSTLVCRLLLEKKNPD